MYRAQEQVPVDVIMTGAKEGCYRQFIDSIVERYRDDCSIHTTGIVTLFGELSSQAVANSVADYFRRIFHSHFLEDPPLVGADRRRAQGKQV